MKKLYLVSVVALALMGCKTEIEKEVSLNTLLNEPLKTETAILNVEIPACGSHEDSRKESDSLIKVKQKIPNVFLNAKYKECYTKNVNSFASFEIPIGVGKLDDVKNQKLENDINIYSYKSRILNVRTSGALAKRIRDFVKSEFINKLEMDIILNVKNDTGSVQNVAIYSAYVDEKPVEILETLPFPKGESAKIKLSNASADKLWKYDHDSRVVVLSEPITLEKD